MSDYEIQSINKHEDTFIWKIDKKYLREELPDLMDSFNDRDYVLFELFEPIQCNSGYRIVSYAQLIQEADHEAYVKWFYNNHKFDPTPSKKRKRALLVSERQATAVVAHNLGFKGLHRDDHYNYIDESFLDDNGDLVRIYNLWRMKDDNILHQNVLGVMKRDHQVVYEASPHVPEEWQAVPHTIAYHTSTGSNVTTGDFAPRENPVDIAFDLEYGSYPHTKYSDISRHEVPVVDEFKKV